jgi:hypothetical protein
MSGLLYVIGGLAIVAGAVLVGFGIPINEFSFGNTLIISGVTTAVGGLIVVGLGVVAGQLQKLAENMTLRPAPRASRPMDFEASPAPVSRSVPAKAPFPPMPKADIREPAPVELPPVYPAADMPADDHASVPSFAPALRNPYEAPATVEDDVSLSPQQHPAPAHASAEAGYDEPSLDAGWRPSQPMSQPAPSQTRQTAYFDAMWPSEEKPVKSPLDSSAKSFEPRSFEPKPFEPKFEPPPREFVAAPARRAEPEAAKPRPASEARQPSAAILKSGVVDGMAYTLYVDGSIEAELPQGTLRFASINELRSHLENNA